MIIYFLFIKYKVVYDQIKNEKIFVLITVEADQGTRATFLDVT